MKILLVNHFPLLGSGSGVYITNIARSLEKRGHEVCIIMPENTTHISKIDNVKIHPVFFKNEEVIKGQLDFNFPCMDPHPRSSFLFKNMTEVQVKQYENAFRNAIEEEIKCFKPDIIHAQHIWIISGLLKDYDIPYLITSHGAEFITYRETDKFDRCGINAIAGCKKLIAISKANIEEIIDKFPKVKNRMIFLKSGYNSNDFYVEDLNKEKILKENLIDKEFQHIVLFVGRVSKMKGLDVLFEAAKTYENENTLTLIVGEGGYKNELEDLKKKLKLQNVVFLGSKGHNELRKLYNIADVLVLPSRKEALPLVAIEAIACGTPAIVTNLLGMEEIINKDIGLIFQMDDEIMLSEKIKSIINREVVFDRNKIADYAKDNYSQEIFMDKLIEIYKEVKNGKE